MTKMLKNSILLQSVSTLLSPIEAFAGLTVDCVISFIGRPRHSLKFCGSNMFYHKVAQHSS